MNLNGKVKWIVVLHNDGASQFSWDSQNSTNGPVYLPILEMILNALENVVSAVTIRSQKVSDSLA